MSKNLLHLLFVFLALCFGTSSVLAVEDLVIHSSPQSVEKTPEQVSIEIDTNPNKSTQNSKNNLINQDKIEEKDFLETVAGMNNSDGCASPHNSAKSYSIDQSARLIAGMLKKGPNKMLTQFQCQDAYSAHIPSKVQEVYQQSWVWYPYRNIRSKGYSNDYVQCTTFVFMAFQLAGQPIEKKGRTNAADFLAAKYTGKNGQFEKFRNGEATELPRVGDVAIWSEKATKTFTGHAGVIIEVRSDTIRIANANSNRAVHEYRYHKNEKTGTISIIGLAKDWPVAPDYWLRKREL